MPGPRSNLELLAAAAEEVSEDWARWWAAQEPDDDPTTVFVISVGLVALGRFLAAGSTGSARLLRRRAADDEWRVREAVAIALQRLADERPEEMALIAGDWAASGNALVTRAAVAAVAEPRLLRTSASVGAAIDVLEAATALVAESPLPRRGSLRVLRQALGYAWSVVIAADVDAAWPRFVEWSRSDDPDIEWIVRENLKKNRLIRMDLNLLSRPSQYPR